MAITAEKEVEVKSYAQIISLLAENDPVMARVFRSIEANSEGQPVPCRFKQMRPLQWSIYWELDTKLTIEVFRFRHDNVDSICSRINGVVDEQLTPSTLGKKLFSDVLGRPLQQYQQAKLVMHELGPLNACLQWSKCWRWAFVGKELCIYLQKPDQVLLSYIIGDLGDRLEKEFSTEMAVRALKPYIRKFVLDKKPE